MLPSISQYKIMYTLTPFDAIFLSTQSNLLTRFLFQGLFKYIYGLNHQSLMYTSCLAFNKNSYSFSK